MVGHGLGRAGRPRRAASRGGFAGRFRRALSQDAFAGRFRRAASQGGLASRPRKEGQVSDRLSWAMLSLLPDQMINLLRLVEVAKVVIIVWGGGATASVEPGSLARPGQVSNRMGWL